ncbi:hypothetical protein GCM10027176_84510 [Actinoallomurus bryophytorum]|uniref:Uncharacterized protein n=1 Tax=Actinoallomurus bryophytorum TaxID=1490222 RepID=A0A543CT65_9ACTN|nr:hypothetical protein [Actinoallomurus bryophytorum]TQM00294.1 hypothetical protein FB559_6005 [Actinoallomurus bryophytorum]
MEQQIRGWRFAAERTRRRRPSREVPLAPSAQMIGGMLLTACRMLGRMATQARAGSRTGMARIEGVDMKRVAGGVGLMAAGVGVAGYMATRPRMGVRAPKNHWITVTVNCSPQRLASRADLPEPITRLGDAVDIRVAPAPGDRGTELGARLRELPRTKIVGMVNRRPEEDPRRMVEEALRQAKSMIETGEVLRPDWPPSTQPAQVGKLLEFAGRRGGRP